MKLISEGLLKNNNQILNFGMVDCGSTAFSGELPGSTTTMPPQIHILE